MESVKTRRRSSSSHANKDRRPMNGMHINGTINGIPRRGRGFSNTSTITVINKVPISEENDSATSEKHTQEGKPDFPRDKSLERNIDNVIFGDVTFKAWYPSWYPKEIIGEKGLNGDSRGIVVSELYICKRCFGYGKNVVDWVRHTRCCERGIPGSIIYTHDPEGVWSVWEVDGGVDTVSFLHPNTCFCFLEPLFLIANPYSSCFVRTLVFSRNSS